MNSMSDSGDFQDVESNYSGRLCHVSSHPAIIPSSRSMLSRDKRLPLNTWNSSGLQENVFGNQFSTFDSPRDHPQRIQSDDVLKERGVLRGDGRTETIRTSDDGQHQGTIPMPTFATTSSTDFYNTGGITAELYGRTAKTVNIGVVIRQIPLYTLIPGVENTIQKSSDYLFWFSIGCHLMDQGSGDG